MRHDLTPVIYDAGQVEALAEEVRYSGSEPIRVHLKIDTGMSRLGTMPRDVAEIGKALRSHAEVELDGAMTHFACADSGDAASIEHQLDLFDEALAGLEAMGIQPRLKHAANSAALLRSPRARLDMVRPGVALFGVDPTAAAAPELRPAMCVKTQIISVREIERGQSVGYGATWSAARTSRIATVPMGYADGLSRAMSNSGHMLVRGRRAPIAGVVSMDMCMLDVTEIDDVRAGDEVVVMGEQKGPLGHDVIRATEIADALGTIVWEVLTSVSRRVPRFYREP